MKFIKAFITTTVLTAFLSMSVFAQSTGSIGGQVVDSFGSVIVGATVTIISADGATKTAESNESGNFTVSGLAPGKYTVMVIATNFGLYENTEVVVTAGQKEDLTVLLDVEAVEEQVDVAAGEGVSTDSSNNAGATVLSEQELEALPDDPDELAAALQALAGPSAGPNGGQIYIDGFTGGNLPPKDSIREIRINNNPFSAEFDRFGFGRIEILTKPGSDKFRGSADVRFNDESLNSRNPFSANRASSQMRSFGGNFSGPIQKGRSSFFVSVNNRVTDSNSVVNAIILDPNLNPVAYQEEFQVPNNRFSISPRLDYAINDKNTLVIRYDFSRSTRENQGIGGTSLPSRAYESKNTDHEIRITETMMISPTTVNETRFELDWSSSEQIGDNSIPTLSVSDAFTSGGSQVGISFDREREYELQNYTTMSFGAELQHTMKFGVRLQGTYITDRSESNFGGSFSFPGAQAVTSPDGCFPGEPGCTVITPALSPLEQYVGNVLGQTDDRYLPGQFSITTGNPEQKVSRTDVGVFITDDWRVNPGLTLGFGLRYENQTNISDNMNFAPRFSFAWSPGAGGQNAPKTVIRGGFGMFYDRFSEGLTLNALRFNGSEQLNLIVNANDPDPVRRAAAIALLQQVQFMPDGTILNAPTASQILSVLPQSNTIRSVSPELKSPRMMQGMIGVERQLPGRTTASLFYIAARTDNVLRSRNINAPICPMQEDCFDAPRPDPTAGNIYQYESTGTSTRHEMVANFRTMFSSAFSLFGNYRLGYSEGDTDGSGSFPAYSYDLTGEMGRSSYDTRHNFMIGGSFRLPWDVSVSPFIMANSGSPFNITRGIDVNGDALFTERPTFGELGARCDELGLTNSFCDVAGEDPNQIIPRNYGQGPKFFSVNLRLGKTFGFGSEGGSSAGDAGRGGMRGRGGRGMGRMGGFGGGERKKYNLNFGVNISNLFNNVNYSSPVGNLSSNRFGQSTSTAGSWGRWGGGGTANRRIELSARFSW